ncbi:MAG: hypothetical protein RR054_02060 [Clostridia bacterium]
MFKDTNNDGKELKNIIIKEESENDKNINHIKIMSHIDEKENLNKLPQSAYGINMWQVDNNGNIVKSKDYYKAGRSSVLNYKIAFCLILPPIEMYSVITDISVTLKWKDADLNGSNKAKIYLVDKNVADPQCNEELTSIICENNESTFSLNSALAYALNGNYFVIVAENEAVKFYNQNSVTECPIVDLTIIKNTRSEIRQSYIHGEIGKDENYKINTRTGKLFIQKSLANLYSNKKPLNLTINYIAEEKARSLTDKLIIKGWKFNYQQYIIKVDSNFCYINEAGEIIYFKKGYVNIDNIYIDDNSLGLILKIEEKGYVLLDDNYNKMTFDEDGILISEKDVFENEVKIEYIKGNNYKNNKSKYISQITDGSGKIALFSYSKNAISIDIENESIVLNMNEKSFLESVTCKNNTVRYGYELYKNYERLNSIESNEGKCIDIKYSQLDMSISDINEYVNHEDNLKQRELIKSYSFIYDRLKTYIINEKNVVYIYQYNQYGKSESIFEYAENGIYKIENKNLGLNFNKILTSKNNKNGNNYNEDDIDLKELDYRVYTFNGQCDETCLINNNKWYECDKVILNFNNNQSIETNFTYKDIMQNIKCCANKTNELISIWFNNKKGYIHNAQNITIEICGKSFNYDTHFLFENADERKLFEVFNTNSEYCIIDRSDKVIEYDYNKNGKLKSKKDKNGFIREYKYDVFGNLININMYNSNYCNLTDGKPIGIASNFEYYNGEFLTTIKKQYESKLYHMDIERDYLGKIKNITDFNGNIFQVENSQSDIINKEIALFYDKNILVTKYLYDNGNKLSINETNNFSDNLVCDKIKKFCFCKNCNRIEIIKLQRYCDNNMYDCIEIIFGNGEGYKLTCDKYGRFIQSQKLINGAYGVPYIINIYCNNDANELKNINSLNYSFLISNSQSLLRKTIDGANGQSIYYKYDNLNRNIERYSDMFSFKKIFDKNGRINKVFKEYGYLTYNLENGISKMLAYNNVDDVKECNKKIETAKYYYTYCYKCFDCNTIESITVNLGVYQWKEVYFYDELGRIYKVSTELNVYYREDDRDIIEEKLDNRKLKSSVGLNKKFSYLDTWNEIKGVKKNFGTTTLKKYISINMLTNKLDDESVFNTQYEYDGNGNIACHKQNGQKAATFEYDIYARVIRENNPMFNATITYDFDINNNIINIKNYELSYDKQLPIPKKTICFKYEKNPNDLLININNESYSDFIYDEVGCPITYKGKTLRWNMGNLLVEIADKNHIVNFNYNANGVIINKQHIADNILKYYIDFIVDDEKILCELHYNDTFLETIRYIYGNQNLIGFLHTCNSETHAYYYHTNLKGDIVAIFNEENCLVGEYSYDALGNCVIITDINGIATTNPMRYKGMRYDCDIEMYYNKKQWYDTETGRYINITLREYFKNRTSLNPFVDDKTILNKLLK